MIIGNWNDSNMYHLLLNGEEIPLKHLNKHVLECLLPKFNINPNEAGSDCLNLESGSIAATSTPTELSLNEINTFIYLYENKRLYCNPIPFKFKYSSFQLFNNVYFSSNTAICVSKSKKFKCVNSNLVYDFNSLFCKIR